MTWGILALVKYIQNAPAQTVSATPTPKTEEINANLSNSQVASTNTNTNTNQAMPATDKIHVEFKSADKDISVEATIDGKKESTIVKSDAPKVYDPQESLKLRYYKGFASEVQLNINGKQITPPAAPRLPGANGIEFEINKENIAQISTKWSNYIRQPERQYEYNSEIAIFMHLFQKFKPRKLSKDN